MLAYDIGIGILVYLFAKALNFLRFNERPLKRGFAILFAVFVFLVLFVTYILVRLHLHIQLEANLGVQVEQRKIFSIAQSIFWAILFFVVIKKVDKKASGVADVDGVEPKS